MLIVSVVKFCPAAYVVRRRSAVGALCHPLFVRSFVRRGKFLTKGPRSRRNRRAAAVTLATHHKAPRAARTARAPRARELVAQGSELTAAGRTN